jgi:iron complex outermembrane receptor protein
MNVFDNLKLRFSWGLTGNQEIPNKISLISVGTSADADGYFGGSSTTGITFSRVPNPDLKWETTEQFDLGFDFGVLDNRLTGTVDLFHKKTTNVLLELTAKAPAPTEKQWENVPGLKIINDGIEFNLNGNVIDKHDMSLNIGANFSTIRNRVKDLPVSYIATGAASGQGLGDLVEIITNDKPIGTFYGRVFEGFDSEGKSIYKTDKDGNEVKEYLGSALPDFTYGFSTNFIYKNIDFNMYWNGSQGNKVYNNTANALFYKPSLANGSNVTRDVASSKESEGNSTGFSSRYIENGSFLRLSALSIGYTLTIKSLSWLQSARFYVSGNNLLLITHYKGFDPEVNVDESANNVPSLGLDFTSYPKARSIMFGVNLKFK